jgi:hypothetical protein
MLKEFFGFRNSCIACKSLFEMTHHGSAFPFMAIVTTFNLRTSVTHIPDGPNIVITKSQVLTPIMHMRVFLMSPHSFKPQQKD